MSSKDRITEIKERLDQLDLLETRLQFIDFQSEEDKAALRDIWAEQRELEKELEELTE